jgi:hypothetical protein
MTDILSNITFFRSFILVAVKLLAALGLHAENLVTLVDLATAIEEALPPAYLFKVLDNVIPPSLHASLEHFSSSIKAWIVSLSSVPVCNLVLEASRVHAALKAINKDRKLDLSRFGLQSSSLFASIGFIPTCQNSSSSLQPLTSAFKRKPQDYHSAASHPGHSSNRRVKSSSSSPLRARKSIAMDPEDQVVARSPRQVVIRSPSSPHSPSLPHVADCASGRVAQWGRDYTLVTPLLNAFRQQHPKLHELPDHELLPVLLTARTGEATFLRYAPVHATESLKRALRTWFDKKEYKKYRVEKPPDFR